MYCIAAAVESAVDMVYLDHVDAQVMERTSLLRSKGQRTIPPGGNFHPSPYLGGRIHFRGFNSSVSSWKSGENR